MEKLTLDVPEVAELIGIDKNAIYNLCKSEDSDFPFLTIGRRIKIPRAALEDWLNKKATERGA